jgi:hypothetical protein
MFVMLLTLPGLLLAAALPDTLSGVTKGTTVANHKYVVRDSLFVNAGDTLRISSGDTLIMASPTGFIQVLGTFICEGTSTKQNLITVPDSRAANGPGQWGGIVGDSCKYISVKWTKVLWAGGNDLGGHAYRTFDIAADYANTTQVYFVHNTVIGTVDDCIGITGGNAVVDSNVIKWCGAPDGDNINLKGGVVGEIAYNVIWSSGGNGIKVNASLSSPRITNVCIHNNTIVAGGWRRIGELGYAILVDKSARAQIYNNIMGDMYQELEITTKADTIRTVYDNNLFCYTGDSLKGALRYFPNDGVTRQAPHDYIDVKTNALFKNYAPDFTNDWTTLDGTNDYRILSTSAAVGHGFTPPAPTPSNYWYNPYFGNTTQLPGASNIGALGVYILATNVPADTISGVIKGVTKPNHRYIVRDSLFVNAGDTLRFSAGDTLVMASPTGFIQIFGTFICEGTSTNPNLITVPDSRAANGPGQWGGIVGDSCKLISVKWTTIRWAGGNDLGGHAYRTFDIYSDYANTTQTYFIHNTVIGSVDDCIGLHGGNAIVDSNIIKWCGAPDGDNINIKDGVVGEIAYNVIWSSGGNSIKLNSSLSMPRITNMCVHNNTIVAGGWRRIGELGYAILIDASSRAQIYNNIMGDMYQELEITKKADTVRTVYDNNLFCYTGDSLKGAARYFPNDGVARQATHDYIDVKTSALFKSYAPGFSNDWNALDGNNEYRILSTSAAASHGFTPPAPTPSNYWYNPYFGNTTQLPGASNIGALGVYSATGVNSSGQSLPTQFALQQNYPNPFNPTTTIDYTLPQTAVVTLRVFNVLGQEVKTLTNSVEPAGVHSVQFDATNLTSGVYFYRLQAGSFSQVKRMLLLK